MLVVATSIRGGELLSVDVKLGYSEQLRVLSHMMQIVTIKAPEKGDLAGPIFYSSDNIRARNRLARMFLSDYPKADMLLWWDDDEWPEDISLVRKMLDTEEDMIGAPYTNKVAPLRWVHELLPSNPAPRGHVQDVARCGFGFTMTSRKCLETMTAWSVAQTGQGRPYWDFSKAGKNWTPNIFGLEYGCVPLDSECETLLSEDYSFCDRYRSLGGRVTMYGGPGNLMAHAGGHAWSPREMPGVVEMR